MKKAKTKNRKSQPQAVVFVPGAEAKLALNDNQTKQLRDAERLAMSADLGDRRRAQAIVREIEGQLTDKVHSTAVARGHVETIDLEARRGGEIDTKPEQGLCRMKDRDGLRSLFETGRIDKDAYSTGLVYRRLTEAAFSGGKSQLEARTGKTDVDLVGIGFNRAKAATLRTQIDLAVAVRLKDEPVALTTLRAVAGEGRALRTMASGRAFERYAAALANALYVASVVLDDRAA